MSDKIKFTVGGELRHDLPIDGSKTLRGGDISPETKMTVMGVFNPPPLITFRARDEPVMTIHPGGKITLGDNAEPTACGGCYKSDEQVLREQNAELLEALESLLLVGDFRKGCEDVKAARLAISKAASA